MLHRESASSRREDSPSGNFRTEIISTHIRLYETGLRTFEECYGQEYVTNITFSEPFTGQKGWFSPAGIDTSLYPV
ncbi:MAG: hypothetical protein QW356_05645 [Candidatus Hadarchaeales archaeon]